MPAADAARAAVDRLLSHRLMRNRSAEVSTESALRGARASAALEGVDVPLAELRAGEVADPVVQGALRVSVALGSMVETWQRAPGQVLARLHVLGAADLADREQLGRPAPHAGPRLGCAVRAGDRGERRPGRAGRRARARRAAPRSRRSAARTAWWPARPAG